MVVQWTKAKCTSRSPSLVSIPGTNGYGHEHDTFVSEASAVLQNILFLSFRRQPDFLSPLHVERNSSKKYQNAGILYWGTVPGKYYITAMSSKNLSE